MFRSQSLTPRSPPKIARRLADDSRFEILKNWYDTAALAALFRERGHGFWCRELEQFWVCGYTADPR
jgi:hypothetical protein